MRRFAITNQKGGSGKTTSTVNLAACLAEEGDRVLVVDLDPQADASEWLGAHAGAPGLFDLLVDAECSVEDVTSATPIEGVDLVPSSERVYTLEQALAGEAGAEVILREKLAHPWVENYQWVIFDCPPSLGISTTSALVAATDALVTVEAKAMPLRGLALLGRTIHKVQRRLNPSLQLSGVLACRVMHNNMATDVIDAIRQGFPEQALETVIRENIALAEAYDRRLPITQYDPKSNGSHDYRNAAKELRARHG